MKLRRLTVLAAATLFLSGATTPRNADATDRVDHVLSKHLDRFHRSMVRTMLWLAQRHRVEIDPEDVKAAQSQRQKVLLARVIPLTEDDPRIALLFLSEDTSVVPAGSYVLEVDPTTGVPRIPRLTQGRLVSKRGEHFAIVLEEQPDPTPDRGPRTDLVIEGPGEVVASPVYIRGVCYILYVR